jgi:AcrR family transcriptional regulator
MAILSTTESSRRADPTPGPVRRSYDSTLRRQRAAETRARIVAAGSELLHGSSVRDWQELTVRGVAERAGVNERTVYRHFVNEQGLRDAVMHAFEEEAGIDLLGMRLEDVADVTARIFAHVSSYPRDSQQALDPTLLDAKQRQHEALLAAVEAGAGAWPEEDRAVAAAVLDVLWSVATYERLVGDWQLDAAEATRGISWVIGLIRQAIVENTTGLT